MKKILIIALSLGIMVPAIGQIAKQQSPQNVKKETRKPINITPEQYAQRKTEKIDKQVKLSPEQKTQLFEMYKGTAPKRIGAIGHDAKTLNEVNELEKANLSKILTAEQNAQLQKIEDDNRLRSAELKQSREANRRKVEADQVRPKLTDDLKKK